MNMQFWAWVFLQLSIVNSDWLSFMTFPSIAVVRSLTVHHVVLILHPTKTHCMPGSRPLWVLQTLMRIFSWGCFFLGRRGEGTFVRLLRRWDFKFFILKRFSSESVTPGLNCLLQGERSRSYSQGLAVATTVISRSAFSRLSEGYSADALHRTACENTRSWISGWLSNSSVDTSAVSSATEAPAPADLVCMLAKQKSRFHRCPMADIITN